MGTRAFARVKRIVKCRWGPDSGFAEQTCGGRGFLPYNSVSIGPPLQMTNPDETLDLVKGASNPP